MQSVQKKVTCLWVVNRTKIIFFLRLVGLFPATEWVFVFPKAFSLVVFTHLPTNTPEHVRPFAIVTSAPKLLGWHSYTCPLSSFCPNSTLNSTRPDFKLTSSCYWCHLLLTGAVSPASSATSVAPFLRFVPDQVLPSRCPCPASGLCSKPHSCPLTDLPSFRPSAS